jgi:hypothetical protein
VVSLWVIVREGVPDWAKGCMDCPPKVQVHFIGSEIWRIWKPRCLRSGGVPEPDSHDCGVNELAIE